MESRHESLQFGLSIYRLDITESDDCGAHDIANQIRSTEFDVIVSRVTDAQLSSFVNTVCEGFCVLVADSLLEFSYSFDNPGNPLPSVEWPNSFRARAGNPIDEVGVRRIAVEAFRLHRSHYHANKMFNVETIASGYEEWAARELLTQDVFMICDDDKGSPKGFISLQILGSVGKIVLNAVDVNFQGQGVYRSLIVEALRVARERGCEEVRVATPSTNTRPINIWIKSHFRYRRLLHTVHVMRSSFSANLSTGI